jgi:hypothetical protein
VCRLSDILVDPIPARIRSMYICNRNCKGLWVGSPKTQLYSTRIHNLNLHSDELTLRRQKPFFFQDVRSRHQSRETSICMAIPEANQAWLLLKEGAYFLVSTVDSRASESRGDWSAALPFHNFLGISVSYGFLFSLSFFLVAIGLPVRFST